MVKMDYFVRISKPDEVGNRQLRVDPFQGRKFSSETEAVEDLIERWAEMEEGQAREEVGIITTSARGVDDVNAEESLRYFFQDGWAWEKAAKLRKEREARESEIRELESMARPAAKSPRRKAVMRHRECSSPGGRGEWRN